MPSNYVKREKTSIFDSIKNRVKKKDYKSSPLASPCTNKAFINIDINDVTKSDVKNVSTPNSPLMNEEALKVMVNAKYNYDAQQTDELTLVKGDKIAVLEKSSDGWWKGRTQSGNIGWFPSNYVQEEELKPKLDDKPSIYQNDTLNQNFYQNDDVQKISLVKTNGSFNRNLPVLDVVVALYPFQSQNDEELSFQKNERLKILERPENDPDWWKAQNDKGEIGLVPKNYVKVTDFTDSNPKSMHGDFNQGDMNTSLSDHIGVNNCNNNSLINQPWYFGSISRGDCDQLLNERAEDGDFLIRDSETNVNKRNFKYRTHSNHIHL